MQIKLLTLDSSEYTLEQQLRKISEEHHEVISYSKNLRNLLEELMDLMQACKTCIEILQSDYGNEIVEYANNYHIKKLKVRHADGKIKLLEDEE